MEIALLILSILCLIVTMALLQSRKSLSQSEKRLAEEMELTTTQREQIARLKAEQEFAMSRLEETRRLNDESMASLQRQQQILLQQSEARFRLMANEIVTAHTAQMNSNNEKNLGQLLNPLKDDIERFRREVTDFYGKEAAERFSLQERIKELIDANNSIGREARQLSSALRGNSKVQGDWGEMVLETILENSGLRKGEEFEVQQSRDDQGRVIRDENGRGLRPDVVVHYPGGRSMVIDSKVSLTSFIDYVNSETEADRERFGRQHLASIMKHVNELSGKSYQDYVGTKRLDFVMMFIPNEGAYAAALTIDPSLWQKAYDKRVLIVSPTQLVASLRIVSQLWSQDRQSRNAIDIAEKSGAMYDKFVGFVDDMEKIDRSLTSSRAAYDSAMKKLRDGTGSLISRAQKLRDLGIKASKRLPDSDAE